MADTFVAQQSVWEIKLGEFKFFSCLFVLMSMAIGLPRDGCLEDCLIVVGVCL